MAGKRCDPPTLSDDVDFDEWEREFQIWQIATDVEKGKQGARIYLSLKGKARENCKNIDVTSLQGDNGVKVLLDKLRALYAKDEAQVLFQIIEEFETYQRPDGLDIKDFLNEWDRKYEKCKAKKATWQDNVLAHKLLKAANIDQDKQLLIRATISGLTVDEVKKQIRAVFDRTASASASNASAGSDTSFVKVEPTYFGNHIECEEAVYFSDSDIQFHRGRGRRRGRGGWNFNNNRRGRSPSRGSPSRGSPSRGSSHFRGSRPSSAPPGRSQRLNPPDRTGAPSRCAICGSVRHYAAECQHNEEQQPEMFENSIPTLLTVDLPAEIGSPAEITLPLDPAIVPQEISANLSSDVEEEHIPSLFANDIHEKYQDCFTGEALNSAILDSSCRKNASGRLWYECFLQSLSPELQKVVEENTSETKFRFGDGAVIPSMKKVLIPCAINGMRVNIQTEVIDNRIPLLR